MNERPDKYPDWALQDITEEIIDDNGKVIEQGNVYEPPQVKKQYGVLNKTTMGRQWFNWLFRYVNNWIKYLDEPATFKVGTVPLPEYMPVGKTIFIVGKSINGSKGAQAINDGEKWRFTHNYKEIEEKWLINK